MQSQLTRFLLPGLSLSRNAAALASSTRMMAAKASEEAAAAKKDDTKPEQPATPSYVYASPGSSMREASYGISISDPVYFYDAKTTSAPHVAVGNPSRQPLAAVKPNKYYISLSDPVYHTELDEKKEK